MQPGSVITPGQGDEQKTEVQAAPPTVTESELPQATNQEQVSNKSEAEPATEPSSQDTFRAAGFDENTEQSVQPVSEEYPETETQVRAEASWTASEYIAHHKDTSWFAGLGAATVVITAVIYLVTRDTVTAVVFPIVAVLFGVFAARKPDVLEYKVTNSGIDVAHKHFSFEEFKSFTVHDDGAVPSVLFLPTKRFAPGLTVYFSPDQADEIIDTIALYLPHEDREPDAVDRLMKRVRF